MKITSHEILVDTGWKLDHDLFFLCLSRIRPNGDPMKILGYIIMCLNMKYTVVIINWTKFSLQQICQIDSDNTYHITYLCLVD